MSNELISCIIPTLNEGEHITLLIDNIHMQTYRPIDVIIVDGGSTDNTIELIRPKQSEYNDGTFSIRLLFEKDFGELRSPANARNIGIKQSKGTYIVSLDADIHLIESSSLDKMATCLEKHSYCWVKTKPAIDTELERQISMGDTTKIHLAGFKREFIESYLFNAELGLGEDEEFRYRAGIEEDVICDTTLARHYPHTLSEYKGQQIWYGRTYLKLIQTVKGELRTKWLLVFAKNLFYLLFPLLFVVSFALWFYELYLALLSVFGLVWGLSIFRSKDKSIERIWFLLWRNFFEAYYFTYGILKSIKREIYVVISLSVFVYLLFNIFLTLAPKFDESLLFRSKMLYEGQLWLKDWEDTRFLLFFLLVPFGNFQFARILASFNVVLMGYLVWKYTNKIGVEHSTIATVLFIVFAMFHAILFTYNAENFIATCFLVVLFLKSDTKKIVCLTAAWLFKPIALPFIIGLKKTKTIAIAFIPFLLVFLCAVAINRTVLLFESTVDPITKVPLWYRFIQYPIEWATGSGMYKGALSGGFLMLISWHENMPIVFGLLPLVLISIIYVKWKKVKVDFWVYFVLAMTLLIWFVRPTGRYLLLALPMMCILCGAAFGGYLSKFNFVSMENKARVSYLLIVLAMVLSSIIPITLLMRR